MHSLRPTLLTQLQLAYDLLDEAKLPLRTFVLTYLRILAVCPD
jgi:hypothetical protein